MVVFHVDFCCFLVCFTVWGKKVLCIASPKVVDSRKLHRARFCCWVPCSSSPRVDSELTLLQRKLGNVSFIAFHMSLEVTVLVL